MVVDELQSLKQTVDYIGTLSTQLRGLLGYPTLINELIQNADDSRRADGTPTQSMTFDVRDEGLIVENDGVFSDCGRLVEEVCPWRQDQDRMCDFHRFLNIASGNKREEEGTTGAFGVGFISIYQITDRPELRSAGRHWVINPERNGEITSREIPYANNTEFYFPWAMDANSRLRRALRAEPVSSGVTDTFFAELHRVIPQAILFLKNLKKIELKKKGQLIKSVSRVPGERNGLQVFDGDDSQHWYLLKGAFEEKGETLKVESDGRIEEDKKTEVSIAIPEQINDCDGLLYAFLPSQHKTNLPFHINADFFPHSDRKQILFGEGYQGRWNAAAIRSAACLLAQNILVLRDRLGHHGLWKIIESVQKAAENEEENPFGVFWEEMRPRLIEEEVVFTSRQMWAEAPGTVWIRGEDEEALGVLEQIGLKIVHPDLRSHLNVLQNLGVQRLSAGRLASELIGYGLTGAVPLEGAPQWLRNRDDRYLLGEEVGRLLVFEGSAQEVMAKCAIALGRDHCFHGPANLFSAGDDTVGLFGNLDSEAPFVSRDNPQAILDLVPGFGVDDALGVLEDLSEETLALHWAEDNGLPAKIVGWFERKREWLRSDEELQRRLRQIPIIPSGDKLRPLRELVVPGTFEDPLHLASVVDLDALGDHREFLLELEAQALTIQTYAFREVPRAFNAGVEIPRTAIRTLVGILASHRGELVDGNIQRELSGCRLVECEDGIFRYAHKVYFKSREITEILGGNVPVAVEPDGHDESVVDLYEWLGVATSPRAADLLDRISSIVEHPPTEKTKETIGKIFGYIGNHWSEGTSSFDGLRQQKWLPAQGNDQEWFLPDELYASYQRHLFESQAQFLDVPHTGRGGAVRDFIDYLGIKIVPSTRQVIDHLLWCVENDKRVNTEVYTTLNQRTQEDLIVELRGWPCLLLESGQYVRPNQVFWGEHPFGHFRHRLSAEWRSYTALFKKLGVREEPEVEDVIAVLEEIEAEYLGSALDEEARVVLMRCWGALDDKLQRGELDPGLIEGLRERKVVPNDWDALYPPIWMFFEDRSGLAERFGGFLENNVISRPQGAWRAMQAAGVRSLKSAVQIDLVECEGEEFDPNTTARLKDSSVLVKRILDATDPHEWDLSLLDEAQVFAVDELKVRLAIEVFNQRQETGPEEVRTFFDRGERILYYRRSAKELACAPMARELAAAMNTGGEVGHVAAGLKEVLSASSVEMADEVLDELGYARIEEMDDGPASDVGVVGMGAVEEPAVGEDEEEAGVPIGSGVEAEGGEEVDIGSGGKHEGNEGLEDSGEEQVEPVEEVETVGCTEPSSGNGQGEVPDAVLKKRESAGGGGSAPVTEDRRTTPRQNGSDPERRHTNKTRSGRGGWFPVNVVRLPGDEITEGGSRTGQGTERVDRINAIDEAGIQHVLEYERRQGRIPREEAHNNPGYDIKSRDGLRQRLIEVKSIDGEWGEKGVALSDTQFDFGRNKGNISWLYVVENALEPDARIYRIQKATGLVNKFIFDRSWKQLAEKED